MTGNALISCLVTIYDLKLFKLTKNTAQRELEMKFLLTE